MVHLARLRPRHAVLWLVLASVFLATSIPAFAASSASSTKDVVEEVIEDKGESSGDGTAKAGSVDSSSDVVVIQKIIQVGGNKDTVTQVASNTALVFHGVGAISGDAHAEEGATATSGDAKASAKTVIHQLILQIVAGRCADEVVHQEAHQVAEVEQYAVAITGDADSPAGTTSTTGDATATATARIHQTIKQIYVCSRGEAALALFKEMVQYYLDAGWSHEDAYKAAAHIKIHVPASQGDVLVPILNYDPMSESVDGGDVGLGIFQEMLQTYLDAGWSFEDAYKAASRIKVDVPSSGSNDALVPIHEYDATVMGGVGGFGLFEGMLQYYLDAGWSFEDAYEAASRIKVHVPNSSGAALVPILDYDPVPDPLIGVLQASEQNSAAINASPATSGTAYYDARSGNADAESKSKQSQHSMQSARNDQILILDDDLQAKQESDQDLQTDNLADALSGDAEKKATSGDTEAEAKSKQHQRNDQELTADD